MIWRLSSRWRIIIPSFSCWSLLVSYLWSYVYWILITIWWWSSSMTSTTMTTKFNNRHIYHPPLLTSVPNTFLICTTRREWSREPTINKRSIETTTRLKNDTTTALYDDFRMVDLVHIAMFVGWVIGWSRATAALALDQGYSILPQMKFQWWSCDSNEHPDV